MLKVKYKIRPVSWKVLEPKNWKIGMRVRRGPDWCWDNQDHDKDGVPGAGTIIKLLDYKGPGELNVIVQWDGGEENSYHGGHVDDFNENKPRHDLLGLF